MIKPNHQNESTTWGSRVLGAPANGSIQRGPRGSASISGLRQSETDLQGQRLRTRRGVRRGLAPLELVLWIPILLMVAALMVIYGTSVSWRIRGEVASRDAVWRVLTPRTGANEPRPVATTWPHPEDNATYNFRDADQQLTLLDDPAIAHPVVRGPLDYGWQVTPILDPDAEGLLEGETSIRRPFPMLARLGNYQSGEIVHSVLDRSWTIGWSFRRGLLPWPNEIGGFRPWSIVPDVFRRSTLIYRFPEVPGARSTYESIVNEAIAATQLPGLRVLDSDDELIRYTGSAFEFHPRAGIECSTDQEEVRDRAMERFVIDWIAFPPEQVGLGGVTLVPRRLTEVFSEAFNRRIAEIERRQMAGQITPAELLELGQLRSKVEQLRNFEAQLPTIENRLRGSSTARL